MRRFCVYTEWNYCREGWTEYCAIYPSKPEYEMYDGYNLCGTNDGVTFDIYDTLEEAIIKSGFNGKAIEFKDLTRKELKEKKEILSKYEWSYKKGYVKKEGK